MTDFERVKEKTDLLALIEGETGFKLKRSHLEECPFCSGHECFSVNNAKGVYKCFQCDAAGDVFTFFEKYHNVDTHEALKRAAAAVGVTLTEPARREVRLTTRERIFIEAADYYHRQFNENGAKSYLIEKRGHKEDVLRSMRIGWTDGGLADHLKGKGFSEEDIKASGLAREKTANGKTFLTDTFFRHLAIFPHMGEGGRVLHFTVKDPEKRIEGRSTPYQLKNEYRHREWRFYNQGALQRFNEIIVEEGENDLLSTLDAGIQHVIGLIGQPSEQQIHALKAACHKKHVYLWVDNDFAGRGGWRDGKWHDGYIRQICAGLQGVNVRIISHPSGEEGTPEYIKDPDDYLRGFAGDKRKEIKRLQAEAMDYISWEIAETARLSGLEDRLKALKDRKIFAALGDMMEAEKLVFVEKLESLGLTRKAIEEQIDVSQDLLAELSIYFGSLGNKREGDPNHVAAIIFKHFGKLGQVFRDRENKVYIFYKHTIYEIGNNLPFNALMKKTTRLLHSREPGKSVWESLACEAYNFGRQIDLSSWLYTDRATDAIYANLNSPNNVIFKITREGTMEIQNGLNEEGVLLKSSKKIMPVNYLPDTDIAEGMAALKELIFDNFACEAEQKYLVLCWFFSAFLLDFVPYRALMKFSGSTSSGKTTAARLLSVLIYGSEHLGDPSTAAMYAVSSQNPFLVIDNLESDDITKGGLKFLLLSATGGGKEKRTQGTETETIEEMPKSLVLVTAIEPFTKPELINRTFDIEYGNKWKSENFIEDEVIRQIIKKRDLILSAVIKLIQTEVLPNLEKRREFITILKKDHKGHSKNRTDEFLAMMMLMLEKLVPYIPYWKEGDPEYGFEERYGHGDSEIRKAWITYQDAKAKETETGSSSIIKLLDGLVREYKLKMKEVVEKDFRSEYEQEVYVYTHPEYGLEMIKTQPEVLKDELTGDDFVKIIFEFVTTPKDIVAAFDRFCKNNGLKNPYANASVFGERLKNDRHLLEKTGWELVSRPSAEPYWKVVKGQRFWKFRKTIVQ